MVPRHAAWFVALALLAISPAASLAAQGINLSWSRCMGEGIGTQNRAFACNTNSGNHVIVGSFVLQSDMPQVIGNEIIIQLASASATLPDWWQFKNIGTCRSTSLAVNFVANPADVVCADWSQGQAAGGIGAYCTLTNPNCPSPSANAAVIKMINAVPQAGAQDLAGGVEYFDFNILINNLKTVGTGSCTGCSVPVCIVLNSINVVQRGDVSHQFLTTPTVPGGNYVTWQGGGVPVTPQGTGCPAATPTGRSTWGMVKALFR